MLDLPARVDEPKLVKTEGDLCLKCALANRSDEPLVGVRLTLMFIDSANKSHFAGDLERSYDGTSLSQLRTSHFIPRSRTKIKTLTFSRN